ncbi:MAG: SufS family cysteine desulfurase [Jiangellales bacterium]
MTTLHAPTEATSLDVARVRADFPVLERTGRSGRPLVYLDSAATAQKPHAVIEAEADFYRHHNAAVHRGAHLLAEESTAAYEGARATIARFVGGQHGELVLTRNATEALNLLAYSIGNASSDPTADPRLRLGPGDEVCVTEMEHHANLVPWQELCRRTGATLRWIPLAPDGTLDLSDLDTLVSERTKVLSFVHQSNVVGTVNPVEVLRDRARVVGALVFLDACQSVPHRPVDVVALDVDAVALSGHKMLGPTGIGALWGRRDLLEALPPFITGGSMIETVTMERSTYAPPPLRFEAGTPPIAQAVGLAAAADYLADLGMQAVEQHVSALTHLAVDSLLAVPGVSVLGPAGERGPVVAFAVEGVHPHDLSQVLDAEGVAVRAGHHCAWPLHRVLGVQASARASFAVYNDTSDVAALVDGVRAAQRLFGVG